VMSMVSLTGVSEREENARFTGVSRLGSATHKARVQATSAWHDGPLDATALDSRG